MVRRPLIVSALATLTLAGAVEPHFRVIRPSVSVSADLTPSDPTLERGEHHDLFAIRVASGERLSIRLESDDFDTYLIFLHPDGRQIDNDDYEGVNSGLDVTVSGTGWGWIVPTSWAAEVSGEYTLSVD